MSDTRARLAALRKRMKATETDLVALSPGSHMQWLLGFHPHADERPCLLLVSESGETFLMPVLNAEGSREGTDIAFRTWADEDGPDAALAAALVDIGAEKASNVVLDETMRADFALLLLECLPAADHSFTDQTVGTLRMYKNEEEFRALKTSAEVADAAIQTAFSAARPGTSEREVADVIDRAFTEHDAASLFRIVGSGPNGAFPHHQTGNRLFEEGDAVVVDIGARCSGFPSDITRMVAIGYPPESYREVHAVVEAAVQAALVTAKPGVEARIVDAAARDVITQAGYGEYFVHRTGHGLGIDGHEPPYLTATSTTVLEENMVFSIEPGIYLPDRFGIRLEEIVIMRANGPEILSDLPRDLYIAKM